jgi:hypothetical protein
MFMEDLLTMPFTEEFQETLMVDSVRKKKLKAKINPKYAVTDEQLSERVSDNIEEYHVTPHTDEEYKELIDSHRPRFSNNIKEWL